MDKKTAEHLMEIYARVAVTLNEADPLLRDLSEDDRELHLRALGEMMIDVWAKLQRPIVREFPELDPDRSLSNLTLQRTPPAPLT
jgi:hypothetical protein